MRSLSDAEGSCGTSAYVRLAAQLRGSSGRNALVTVVIGTIMDNIC
jgi:hypothetical protein